MNLIHDFKGEIKTPHDVTFAVSSQVPGHFSVLTPSVLVFWSISRGRTIADWEQKAGFLAVKVFTQVPKTANLKKQLWLFSISPLQCLQNHQESHTWRNPHLAFVIWPKAFCGGVLKSSGQSLFKEVLVWSLADPRGFIKHYQICASIFCFGKFFDLISSSL